MIKVIEAKTSRLVSPANMTLGQVGRIVKWNGKTDVVYVGRIVVRGLNTLYSVDFVEMAKGMNWPNVRSLNNAESEAIEILPPGTKIEITL